LIDYLIFNNKRMIYKINLSNLKNKMSRFQIKSNSFINSENTINNLKMMIDTFKKQKKDQFTKLNDEIN
jgi:hypothetical protein